MGTYEFYDVRLEDVIGPVQVDYEVSEVAAAEKYLGAFLEQFSEYQIVVLTLPMEELELFFTRL